LRKSDPTNAERQRRFRERRREQVADAEPAKVVELATVTGVTDGVTETEKGAGGHTEISVSEPVPATEVPAWREVPEVERYGFDRATLLAALSLAAVSGGYSIYGMTSIFAGAFWPVIALGAALEFGKLRAVVWLRRYGGGAPLLKALLVALVGALMILNAIGAYGFLAKAHIGAAVAGDVAVAGRMAEVEGRIVVQASLLSDFDRRLAQIDGAVEKATQRGRTGSALALAEQERKTRGELVAQRTAAAQVLAQLQAERARIEGDRKAVEAELGPVRYLATLLGTDSETTMRYFILIVALLLDPAAVLLLLAASSARRS
jgi:hypothetical protein